MVSQAERNENGTKTEWKKDGMELKRCENAVQKRSHRRMIVRQSLNVNFLLTGTVVSYSSGQNKVNVRLACNDRATVIALERNGKKTENGNAFRRTRFLNFVLY